MTKSPSRGVLRRSALLAVALVLLVGCGASGPLSGQDLERQQDATDDVARLVVSALVADLDAKAPSADSLGRGLFAGCDGGDRDQASYFVDTFVTYDVLPPATAQRRVTDALRDAGLKVAVDPDARDLTTAKGAVSVDLSTQIKGGGSAGQNIYVSTGCLTVGNQEIERLNSANGRDVKP